MIYIVVIFTLVIIGYIGLILLSRELMINKMTLATKSIEESKIKGVYIHEYILDPNSDNFNKLSGIDSLWVEHAFKNDIGYIIKGIKKIDSYNLIVKFKENIFEKPIEVAPLKHRLRRNILHVSGGDSCLIESLKQVEDRIEVKFLYENGKKIKAIDYVLIKKK